MASEASSLDLPSTSSCALRTCVQAACVYLLLPTYEDLKRYRTAWTGLPAPPHS